MIIIMRDNFLYIIILLRNKATTMASRKISALMDCKAG